MIYLESIANHMWQSTLFAGIAGLLTLALRNNRASARYGLWLAASMKFLVPFSALILAGSHFGRQTAAQITPPFTAVMQQVSQAFNRPTAISGRAASVATAPRPPEKLLPIVIGGVWAAGFLFVISSWWSRSRQIRKAIRAALPLPFSIGIDVMSSPAILEPGVFGILRQVLLLPGGIADQLTPSQFEAILAHEISHVRRRDNLTALLHMLVEALFWFYPLVWWLGARLLQERERACDEAVLDGGSDPGSYADGILRICELYVESPLRCVSGVTGSNLTKRIEQIMANRIHARLSGGKKALFAAGATLALALPLAIGILNAPLRAQTDWQAAAGGKMTFEVASVKASSPEGFTPPRFPLDAGDAFTPTGGRFSANFPLAVLIDFAYKITPTPDQREAMLAHLPGWVATDRFVIDAQGPANSTKDQFRLMMQSLLADRFKLKVHFESQQVAVFALTLVKPGKPGPNLRPHAEGPPCPETAEAPPRGTPPKMDVFPYACEMYGMTRNPNGDRFRWGSRNSTMASLATMLPNVPFSGADATHGAVERTVVDQTGLTGRFDFIIEYALQSAGPAAFGVQPDPSGPAFLDAMRDQLGLKLEAAKGQAQVLVIDHVEKPSEN